MPRSTIFTAYLKIQFLLVFLLPLEKWSGDLFLIAIVVFAKA